MATKRLTDVGIERLTPPAETVRAPMPEVARGRILEEEELAAAWRILGRPPSLKAKSP